MTGEDLLSARSGTDEFDALRHLELALQALDRSGAPLNIGALVDQALHQLREHLADLSEFPSASSS